MVLADTQRRHFRVVKCDKRSINGKLLGIYRGKNIGIKTKETDHME